MRFSRIAVALGLLASAVPAAAAAEKRSPTFSQDVAPILFQQCASCHRPGEAAPFSLLTYEDARKRGKLLAQLTQSRQMPPWKADRGDVPFRNERRLTEEQIATIQQWVAVGMPEGDRATLPTPPSFDSGWTLGKPDLVVKMPKGYKVAAEGRDDYRNFAIPLGLTEDKWVKAIDFRPSARSVVHHTLFILDATGESSKREQASGQVGSSGGMGALRSGGRGGLGGGLSGQGGPLTGTTGSLGGWALGAQPHMLPQGLAYQVPKGSDLILSTHFHPSGKAEEEASTVALYFADKPPTQRFTGVQLPFGFGVMAGIDIPAGAKNFTIQDSFVLPVDVKGFGVSAHAHYLAKEMLLTATLPDGKSKTLLNISAWDFAWQDHYQFRDFEPLPKGTKLSVKIVYDNSADNPHNPSSPPKRVRWGRESMDEMGSITLQVVAAREDDFTKLQDGYKQHVRESVMRGDGPLKKLLEKK